MTKKNQQRLSVLIIAGLVLGTVPAYAADPNPTDIMQAASDVRKLDGSEAVMSLSIIDEKGEKRVREIALATKTYDNGQTEKRIYRFMSPADVKGTGVLAFDYDKKDDDMWIFLPALRKTRRIVSGEKSKAFMGSEFSNADMNTPIISNFKMTLVGSEKVDGVDCHKIEVLPNSDKIGKEEGYSKKVVWVAKADSTIRKSDFYDMDGKLLKELIVKNIKVLDEKKKRARGMYMEMTNKQNCNPNCRKSIFETKQIENSPSISDDHFTTQYLEKP